MRRSRTPLCTGEFGRASSIVELAKVCPVANRIFAGIDAANTTIEHTHLEVADETKSTVKGGFHYGVCRRPGVYLPPRPLMNHGPHRCKSAE